MEKNFLYHVVIGLGTYFVVASDPTQAYNKLVKKLKSSNAENAEAIIKDMEDNKEFQLDSIQYLADEITPDNVFTENAKLIV